MHASPPSFSRRRPHIRAALALSKANAFNYCTYCGSRIVKRCSCGEDSGDGVSVSEAFVRSDPRRSSAYEGLLNDVKAAEKVSAATLRFDSWSVAQQGASGSLFRLMLDFCCRSARRLERYFVSEVYSAFTRPPTVDDLHPDNLAESEDELEFHSHVAALGMVRRRLMWILAGFNVAVDELYGTHDVYHYRRDRREFNGLTTISTSGGSSERAATCYFVQGLWGVYDAFRGRAVAELADATPGSNEHFDFLLQGVPSVELVDALGLDMVTQLLDPKERFRQVWTELRDLADEVDAGTVEEGDDVFDRVWDILDNSDRRWNYLGEREEDEDEDEEEMRRTRTGLQRRDQR